MDDSLRETAERLHAILESAADGILAIDANGTIESANPAASRIFGYDHEELLGANVSMLMPSPHRERHDAYVKHFLDTGEARIIGIGREVTGIRKDGSEFPLYLAVSEGRHRDRPIFTGIVRDLTELRRAEARAQSAEQLASLAVITAGIAHDVGTPMNVILGYADMLRDSLEDPRNKRRAEVISEQVRRVTDLLQTLMNIARPRKMMRTPLQIEQVLEHSLEFFREKLRSRKIEVVRDFHPVPRIHGDRDRLEQMFLNFLVNAADAMPGGGRLTVSIQPIDDERIEISIADSGHGIEPQALGRIFEPFYTSKDRGKGTGLGLVVCRSIILDHQGSVEVESQPEKGTCFRLRFPIDFQPRGESDARTH
jgi:PAS domain S-box-containing protein